MNMIILFVMIVLVCVVGFVVLLKQIKKTKSENQSLKSELSSLRTEKEHLQIRYYDLTQKLEQIELAKKMSETAKKKAVSAKKGVEADNDKLKKTSNISSADKLDTAKRILSKPKAKSKS